MKNEMAITWAPVDQVIPTPDNNRVFPKDDGTNQGLLELAKSIAAEGILEPLLGRPHPTKAGCIDLRAGERRLRAAKLAGMAEVPIIVRDMDDETAMIVTITENQAREDLTPLEEARGIHTLRDRGWSNEAIADKLGRSTKWVARRAQIMSLSPEWMEFLAESQGEAHGISAVHLELIARYPHSIQSRFLEDIAADVEKQCGVMSTHQLRHEMASLMHVIDVAPWKKDDADLVPAAGPCSTCTKRSDCQRELFDEEELEGNGKKAPSDARCLDIDCWNTKIVAHVDRVIEAVIEDHGEAILISSGYVNADSPYAGQTRGDWAFDKARKGEPGAKVAVIVDGPSCGQTKWVKPVSYGGVGSSSNGNGKGAPSNPADLLKTKRRVLHIQRFYLVVNQLIDHVGAIDPVMAAANFDEEELLAFVATFGTDSGYRFMLETEHDAGTDWTQINAFLSNNSTKKQLSLLFVSAIEVFQKNLQHICCRPASQLPAISEDEIKAACDFFGVSYEAWWSEVCDEKAEPKSWAKLEAEARAKKKAGAK